MTAHFPEYADYFVRGPMTINPSRGLPMDRRSSHELLLELLEKHPDFASRFKKRKKPLMAHEVKNFDGNETNRAAILVATALNINSGSAGNHDLYQLFDTYLSYPEARDEINAAVRRAKGLTV